MKRHTFEEVANLDDALYNLAMYDVTKGRLFLPKSMDEAIDLQQNTAEKFNYFKGLIQAGECTFEFIKWDVLQRNGPFPREDSVNIDDKDFVKQITEGAYEEDDISSNFSAIQEALVEMLHSFSDAKNEQKDSDEKKDETKSLPKPQKPPNQKPPK